MEKNNRVLIIDDDVEIRNSYQRILSPAASHDVLAKGASLFDESPPAAKAVSSTPESFELTLTENGEDGVRAVEQAFEQNTPFAVAFIDMRMPGIDGAETAKRIWGRDANMKLVIVTAFSEYTPDDIIRITGRNDLFYFRKPFIAGEIRQFARALTYQWDLERELERKNDILAKQAVTDSLTNLYDHRHIIERLVTAIAEAKRYTHDLSIVMFDIDRFKQINDTYGHQTGDEVLVTVSATIRETLRETDIIGRYGGEEFLAILPYTTLEKAYASTERLRKRIEALAWDKGFTVTTSGGLVHWHDENAADLIMKADSLLYAAKEHGRNRVEVN